MIQFDGSHIFQNWLVETTNQVMSLNDSLDFQKKHLNISSQLDTSRITTQFLFRRVLVPEKKQQDKGISYMGVSKNHGTVPLNHPLKIIGFSFYDFHHPFWGNYPHCWKHPGPYPLIRISINPPLETYLAVRLLPHESPMPEKIGHLYGL